MLLSGDVGQRIFQHPFSWASLGLDVRGRSHTLKVGYRTSQQIRRADIQGFLFGEERAVRSGIVVQYLYERLAAMVLGSPW